MVQEVEDCLAKTAISPKIAKIGEIAVLLKLITTSVGGGKRVPSKNCDFCSFSKNYNNLKKSQFLLKLIKSSVN